MKPVKNNIHLPTIGDMFKARGGLVSKCMGILLCDRFFTDPDCIREKVCWGFKAKVSEDQSLNGAYCILYDWEVK